MLAMLRMAMLPTALCLNFASEAWPWARSSQARSRSKMLGSERLQYPLIQEFILNFSRNSNMI